MGWNGSTLSRHLVTPAHVKTRRGATALGASGQTQSALPCRPGNSLVAQGEVPSIGNGAMRQVFFHCERDFFFALLLIFPFRQEKNGAQTRIKEACHKIYIAIRRSGEFLTGRSAKTRPVAHAAKKSPATSRIGGCPPSAPAEEANGVTKICCFDCWRPSSRKIRELDVTSAQDSGRDPQSGTAFFPKKSGRGLSPAGKGPSLSSTSY